MINLVCFPMSKVPKRVKKEIMKNGWRTEIRTEITRKREIIPASEQ